MRRTEDRQQAADAEIWMEPHADGHRIVYALGVRGQRVTLHLRCCEDGTVTAALERPKEDHA